MEAKITEFFSPERGEAPSTKMTDDKRDSTACVGFPSPAANYMKKGLDLNEFFIKHPSATFICGLPVIPCSGREFTPKIF